MPYEYEDNVITFEYYNKTSTSQSEYNSELEDYSIVASYSIYNELLQQWSEFLRGTQYIEVYKVGDIDLE